MELYQVLHRKGGDCGNEQLRSTGIVSSGRSLGNTFLLFHETKEDLSMPVFPIFERP